MLSHFLVFSCEISLPTGQHLAPVSRRSDLPYPCCLLCSFVSSLYLCAIVVNVPLPPVPKPRRERHEKENLICNRRHRTHLTAAANVRPRTPVSGGPHEPMVVDTFPQLSRRGANSSHPEFLCRTWHRRCPAARPAQRRCHVPSQG